MKAVILAAGLGTRLRPITNEKPKALVNVCGTSIIRHQFDILEEKVPDDIKYEFHRLLIDHGREHCKAQNPTCEEGPLGEECLPLESEE